MSFNKGLSLNNKRRSTLTNVSSILQTILEKDRNPLSDQFLRWKLWYNWKDIVGESISQKCFPVGYNDGVLWVWVKNSAWMHHMLFLREDITHTINTKIGRHFIKMIRFTLDKHEVPELENKEWKEMIDQI
jgi:predicted nucleic acid-binding Zn ribbon protein